MSFLLSDKDQFATLGEVLAFIDSLGFDESDLAFDTNPLPHSTRDSGGVSPKVVGVIQLKTTKTKKRKGHNLSSSTRLQQCKKAEILYLRKRVLELEQQTQALKGQRERPFNQLPQDKPSADCIAIAPNTTWRELVEANYSARQRAEEENRALKSSWPTSFNRAGW
ncbi:hypothetical protein PHYSODRAFT_286316 [Phytophthora sojae]|uniref:BZIP domain-containing protein n=1 Tax=Phytophthora sojae (strain P6497) TaxID=1094619 RepID=G4ZNT7_PHYSP|nr:hypothetical protein PHYSODRAFT_286316 [Phytophthora sojae]EGZ15405.1 hypothetical protein PHYSODRAFT_286316 [Phytophthora sojae]|eukprot:XP_009529154.1 hypothetical protein PHYSODRAFT_286316 [Phytophthora sojae]